jgi:hypothetical protein
VIAFVFPFKATLQAASNAFTDTAPGMLGPLLHLVVLSAFFAILARVALIRFA